MPHHAHSIDRWDDATGSNLYEHLAGVRIVINEAQRRLIVRALTNAMANDGRYSSNAG